VLSTTCKKRFTDNHRGIFLRLFALESLLFLETITRSVPAVSILSIKSPHRSLCLSLISTYLEAARISREHLLRGKQVSGSYEIHNFYHLKHTACHNQRTQSADTTFGDFKLNSMSRKDIFTEQEREQTRRPNVSLQME